MYGTGMKVYNTEEKELIMELSLKWAANPNILIAAKAFGLKATVQVLILDSLDISHQNGSFICSFCTFQVIELQVFAHARITLKPLVPSFPCFVNIHVSLMEKVLTV